MVNHLWVSDFISFSESSEQPRKHFPAPENGLDCSCRGLFVTKFSFITQRKFWKERRRRSRLRTSEWRPFTCKGGRVLSSALRCWRRELGEKRRSHIAPWCPLCLLQVVCLQRPGREGLQNSQASCYLTKFFLRRSSGFLPVFPAVNEENRFQSFSSYLHTCWPHNPTEIKTKQNKKHCRWAARYSDSKEVNMLSGSVFRSLVPETLLYRTWFYVKGPWSHLKSKKSLKPQGRKKQKVEIPNQNKNTGKNKKTFTQNMCLKHIQKRFHAKEENKVNDWNLIYSRWN